MMLLFLISLKRTNFRNFLLDNIHGMGGLSVINDIYGLFVKLGSSTGQYIDCSEIDKIKDIILSNNDKEVSKAC